MRTTKNDPTQELGCTRKSRNTKIYKSRILAPLDGMRLELTGPTPDHDMSRIIARYGVDAVRAAAEKQLKERRKRGRPAERDLVHPDLIAVFEEDARAWLAGRNPIAERSHYAVAKEFASKNPGYNQLATQTRLQKKLSAMREWRIYWAAVKISWSEHPYRTHLRAIKALANLSTVKEPWGSVPQIWSKIANDVLATYREKYGEPVPSLSMQLIEEHSNNAMLRLAEQPRVPKTARPLGLLALEDEQRH